MNSAHPPDSQSSHSIPQTNNAFMPTYEQDPIYYYPDGNIVFLAGGVLFKVYAFLVLSADSTSYTTGNTGHRYPLGIDDPPDILTDSSDTHPIILSNISASQFRNYLLALLGRIHDPKYCSLFTDPKDKEKHSQDLLIRLLDIADVSRQFGMDKLKEWALSQLELILESMYELARSRWDKSTLLRLHSYAHLSGRPKFASLSVNFIQYFISISTVPEDQDTDKEHLPSNLDTCIQLFRDPNLHKDDPTLFGCAFASILALGHRSATWTSKVTRRQKAVLYAAQVQFTASNDEPQSGKWLVATNPLQLVIWICGQCYTEFAKIWAISFRKYSDLKSANRLVALAQLPQYRRLFSMTLDPEFAPHGNTPVSLDSSVSDFMTNERFKNMFSAPECLPPNLPGDTRPRDRIRCTESEWPLGYLDYHIQLVYQELAERYKEIASYVDQIWRTQPEELTSYVYHSESFELHLVGVLYFSQSRVEGEIAPPRVVVGPYVEIIAH